MPLLPPALESFLSQRQWAGRFEPWVAEQGVKIARGKQVHQVRAEWIAEGEIEVKALVSEGKGGDGPTFETEVVLWPDGGAYVVEGSCTCSHGSDCPHQAAILEFLTRALKHTARWQRMFGEVELDEKSHQEIAQKTLTDTDEVLSIDEPDQEGLEEQNPRWARLELRRRRDGDPPAYPEHYAVALLRADGREDFQELSFAQRHEEQPTLVRELDALGLMPLESPDGSDPRGDRWAPDRKEWPLPLVYWQRFVQEALPRLEQKGIQVDIPPFPEITPLIFQTEGWKSEIVEEGKGWFYLSAGFEINGESFELQPILASLVANRFLEMTEGKPDESTFMVVLPDSRCLVVPVGRFRHLMQTLEEVMSFSFSDAKNSQDPLRQLTGLEAAEFLAQSEKGQMDVVSDSPRLLDLHQRISDFQKIDPVPPPPGLEADLRPYQLDGYQWMQFLIEYGLNGILADDMGLGKTLQSLAHILAEVESERNDGLPSLVLAPTSVAMNWQREAAKFAPSLRVLVLQGAHRASLLPRIAESDLVITSYALMNRDAEWYADRRFHLLILDEAQYIKNHSSQIAGNVATLQANHRVCLSGTPVENHLGELWSLMNFLMPGFLGSRDSFRAFYQLPIEKGDQKERREALSRKLAPLILRRTKNDVAKELPPKNEIVHLIDMHSEQKDLYETVRATMDKQVRAALEAQGQESKIVFLEALLKLRMICGHPRLLKEQGKADVESAKFDFFCDLIDTLGREGHRTLVFSQFTSMLSVLEDHLITQKIPYLILTGATKDRQELVERFQGGEGQVFLISLKAGGTGLTLTGADTVIHYDPWWNPAAENQATDRAYRIGQDKPVFVHKLICQNTVEERIHQMQESKDELAEGLLSKASTSIDLTPEAMQSLLSGAGE